MNKNIEKLQIYNELKSYIKYIEKKLTLLSKLTKKNLTKESVTELKNEIKSFKENELLKLKQYTKQYKYQESIELGNSLRKNIYNSYNKMLMFENFEKLVLKNKQTNVDYYNGSHVNTTSENSTFQKF